jgi:type IV pilus assembly protein PilM
LSKSVLSPITALFQPPKPRWACEFTSRHVVVAGVDSSHKKVAGKTAEPLPGDAIVGSLSEKNIRDWNAVLEITGDALRRIGARGFEISLVIPDDSSRISFITAETLPSKSEEREAFVRWKLKKSVPFDVDEAQIAYQVLGPALGRDEKGVELMVAMSPRSIVQEYEDLLERLDIHAGYVVPSSAAVMNLYPTAEPGSRSEDALLVKIGPDSIATMIFQRDRPRFYRRVADMSLYDAVYPTMMYYQDKLGGTTLAGAMVCGYDKNLHSEISRLQDALRLPVRTVEPKSIEDIYKPALGAAGLIWANLT